MRLFASERRDGYHRLHPEIRRWIRDQGWTELREVQERTIHAVMDRGDPLLVSASTAAGKTEAAFLPILSKVAERGGPGLSVVYVAPLKALINDQHRRLEELCGRLGVPLVRWHGDSPQADKTRTLRDPRGVVLITPESVEAMFVRRAGALRKLFSSLEFVIVDELHAFLAGPRGLQLHSLLNRLDVVAGRPIRRVGLSATVGDPSAAAHWLAPSDPESAVMVEGGGGAPELRLQVRSALEPHDVLDPDGLEEEGVPRALDGIADHAFETLRGENNLLFAGSRRRVEAMVDRLRSRSERLAVPNEFHPHHGSLSKELREELEGRLKRGHPPTTAVATTTLELGVDIGSVRSVAQVGAPRSLAGLRQRLGRSGRRQGVPAVLRIYVRQRELSVDATPLDRLRMEVVRSVASIRLLVARFVEPPALDAAVATVVLHQTLSIVCERGGARAPKLYEDICGKGPLAVIDRSNYAKLLRAMAAPDVKLLEQAPDGTIMLGEAGEALTAGRDFYAIFETDEEWQLVTAGGKLGTIPVANSIGVGSLLTFAGRRWRIVGVDDRTKVLTVELHRSGKLPDFAGVVAEPMHDRLVAEMRHVYQTDDVPGYLTSEAAGLLEDARQSYRSMDLDHVRLVASGNDTVVFKWRGTASCTLFAIAMASCGIECSTHDLGVLAANVSPSDVASAARRFVHAPSPSVAELASFVGNLRQAKYDAFVPDDVLRELWARRHEELASELPTWMREVSEGLIGQTVVEVGTL